MKTANVVPQVRVAWVIAKCSSGGIGTACGNAAQGLAAHAGWSTTVASLHDPISDYVDGVSGVRYVGLGLEGDVPRRFLRWLEANPQDVVITNDVSYLEPAFPYLPSETLHVIQLHGTGRRYVNVAIRNQKCVDGILCVANHVAEHLRERLSAVDFVGLLDTIHNGAAFPRAPQRSRDPGPFRLLFIGSMDPLIKGIFDLVPILKRVARLGVPVRLTIAGGYHAKLDAKFKRWGLDGLVTWLGIVPHHDCYQLAAEHDVLLVPSRKESFGMVTVEAMGMGCVPLAYDIVSGSAEIIENGKNGFLLPLGNFMAWAEAIQSLAKDKERLAQFSDRAMKRARSQFNEMVMASNVCHFLERLRTNARTHQPYRISGLPAETKPTRISQALRYEQVSPTIREWIRNWVGERPQLSCWLLKHWT